MTRSQELTREQGRKLLLLARASIADRLGRPTAAMTGLDDPVFLEQRDVFVTLKKDDLLRGCIGSLQGRESILAGVRRNAVSAAFNDSRFTPLAAGEFDRIRISLSILTRPEILEYENAGDLPARLRKDIDGVIVRLGSAGATFLPQVWQLLPDPADFLSHLCLKAGLPDKAWQTSPLEIKTYQAQYFAED